MKGSDYIKAFLAAIALMIINVAVSYGVVAVYAYLIEPGHEPAFYEAAAQDIAPWSSVIAGFILFFIAGRYFAKRKPERNGIAFALTMAGGYAIVDVAILMAVGVLVSLTGIFILSMSTKAIAAYLGARSALWGQLP